MARIIKVKNTTPTTKNWVGQNVAPGTYYQILESEYINWKNSSILLTDIGNGDAVVNNGSEDIVDINKAIDYLKGDDVSKSIDNKLNVHESSRVDGTTTCWSCRGDDSSIADDVGGGTLLQLNHAVSDPVTQSMYFDFNSIVNKTYIHEGYVQCKDAIWDLINVQMVPTVTATQAGSGVYKEYNGYIILPAAMGLGNDIDVSGTVKLVEVVRDIPAHSSRTGYWDATYNTTTKLFEDLTPNYIGTGQFNIFTAEVVLSHFVRDFVINSSTSGPFMLQSADSERIGHNMRLKYLTTTRGTDHAWSSGILLTLYREKLQ